MLRAVSKRIIRCNPFENAKYDKEEKKIRFLQKSDVMKLMAMKMNDREAELARLMFVFSCFTGLAISDMENLEYKHIQTAADGQMYIRKERQKTKVEFIGTMSLSAGIPIESIAKMMGHASISSTQVYAQVTDKKISKDMDRLIAKQSAKEKETSEREACESSDIVTCKMEETA